MIAHRYCVVTGGSGGIGSAVCHTLHTIGLTPIVGYRSNKVAADAVAKHTGGFSLRIDLSDIRSITEGLATLDEKLQPRDTIESIILCGSPPPDVQPLSSFTADTFLHHLNVNVIGTHSLLLPIIKKYFRPNKRGVVIAILTKAMATHDEPATSGLAAYIVGKTALKGLLDVISAEYKWLHVQTLRPGFTRTRMLDSFDPRYLEMVQQETRFSEPEEIARTIVQMITN